MLKFFSFMLAATLRLYAGDAPLLAAEDEPSASRGHAATIAQFSLEMDESASGAKYLLVDGAAFDTMETYNAVQRTARKTIEKGNSVALTLFHVKTLGAEINSFIREYVSILILNRDTAQKLTNAKNPISAVMIYRSMAKTGAILCDSTGGYMFDKTGIYTAMNSISTGDIPLSLKNTKDFAVGLLYGLANGEEIASAAQTGFSYRPA
jgi:sugar/nucleoside kinase (ribokinase family)